MVSNIWKLWKRKSCFLSEKKKKKKSIASTNTCKTCAQRFTLTPLRGDLFHSVELRPHAVRDRKPCLRWQKHVAEGQREMSQEAPALPFKRLESWRNWAAGHHIPDHLTQRSTWAAELSGDSAERRADLARCDGVLSRIFCAVWNRIQPVSFKWRVGWWTFPPQSVSFLPLPIPCFFFNN